MFFMKDKINDNDAFLVHNCTKKAPLQIQSIYSLLYLCLSIR